MPGILLCGAEGEQFLFGNELDVLGADDKRRGSVLLEEGQQMFRQFSEPYNDFWVHVRVAATDVASSNDGKTGTLVEIRSGIKTICRIFSLSAVTDQSTVSFRFDTALTDGGAMDTGPDFPQARGEFINFDIRIQVFASSFTVSFYRNEVLRHTVTRQETITPPDALLLRSRTDTSGQAATYYQDVIVTDAIPTVGMELATLVPSAVGSYSDFLNDYTALDDEGYDQSSVISTTTVGDRESWFFADPEFNLGDKVIYGVAITTVAQLDLAGVISDFEPFVRINGVIYPTAQLGANNVAPNAYTVLLNDNPATGNPWSQAELVGLESGIRAV